ncbi:qcr9 subunit 9 of the ubiquinol cytochrome-c reductase complex [Neodidymelliopsis sp. IMI 364377]|nr:qcr9 subunit 9 of the ubiquinol cytochrome-c reductase complex [Neodidymelliopsis sp. IMI 364377]
MAGVSQLSDSCGSERMLIMPTVMRSNITLLGTVFAAAFGMQLAFDTGSERIWDNINRGRQWKDIKQRYVEAAEDDE